MNIYHLKEKANLLREERNVITKELKETVVALQDKCHHPKDNIVETPLREGTFFWFEEMRLCTVCGLQEERKSWGYEQIKSRGTEVSREKFYEIRDN